MEVVVHRRDPSPQRCLEENHKRGYSEALEEGDIHAQVLLESYEDLYGAVDTRTQGDAGVCSDVVLDVTSIPIEGRREEGVVDMS